MKNRQVNPFPYSYRCRSPKMSMHGGKTWDSCKIIDANGKEIEGRLDTTWGFYIYFRDENGWRKALIARFDTNGLTFDFRKINEKL